MFYNTLQYGVWPFTTPEPHIHRYNLPAKEGADLCGDPVLSHYTFTILKHTDPRLFRRRGVGNNLPILWRGLVARKQRSIK